MTLDRLIVDNFLTYDHLDYSFEKRPLLVQGRNLTDENQKSNGSGKSGIQTAIEFAIAASNSRGVKDSELVSYGYPESRIQLFASCAVRKERLHIDWTIKVKGANKLTLLIKKDKGDWEEVSFSNVNDGKKAIIAWFAISKEDLFNYFIINKTRFKSFYESSNRENVDLINRFSDASIIEGLEEIDTEELEADYDHLKGEIFKQEGKVELIKLQIQTEKNRDFKEEMGDKVLDIKDLILDEEEEMEDLFDQIEALLPKERELLKNIDEIKEDISDCESQIESRNRSLTSYEESLGDYKEVFDECKIEQENFQSTNWEEEREDYQVDLTADKITLKQIKEDQEEWSGKESKLLKFLEKIEVKLSGTLTCPKCSHEFLLDGDLEELKAAKTKSTFIKSKIEAKKDRLQDSYNSIKQSISDLEESLSKINKKEEEEIKIYKKVVDKVAEAKKKVDEIASLIENVKRKIDREEKYIRDNEDEIKEIKLDIKGLSQDKENFTKQIEVHKKTIKTYKEQIKALKPGNNKNEIKSLEEDLKVIETLISDKNEELTKLGDDIYLKNQWKNNFKQFRMFLANQSLEVIEFHNNRYLKEMGCDLTVKIDGFRTLANGKIKDEITAKIIRGGERSYGSFSGGERGRLLFASILANRHMINSTHPYGGLDFLSVDEVFEGVDAIGLKYLVKSAKNLNITAMIITHVTDEETSQDILLIEKVNGISKIIK